MIYAGAGPLTDHAVPVPLVDPATTGPISRSSRLKKGGPCPESRVDPLSESDNTLCEWGQIWDWLKVVRIPGWSAL